MSGFNCVKSFGAFMSEGDTRMIHVMNDGKDPAFHQNLAAMAGFAISANKNGSAGLAPDLNHDH